MQRLANSFAAAYADEDAARHLAAADVGRPARQPGQPPAAAATQVVDVYQGQFAGNRTTGFELTDLEAEGGPVGRATARYRASYKGEPDTTGTMTWDVIRERGRPRISLILAAARLDSAGAVSERHGRARARPACRPAGWSRTPPSRRRARGRASCRRAPRRRRRPSLRSAASAASLSCPVSVGSLTRMSRSTRTASVAGRRPGEVAVMSITFPPGWSVTSALNSPLSTCASSPATRTAASAGRDRAAHRDRLRAHGAAVARDVELEGHARLVRRPRRLAAGGERRDRRRAG